MKFFLSNQVHVRKYNISVNRVHFIKQLYDKATSAVQMHDNILGWFRTTSGLRQGRTSSTLKHFFLERIISDALEEYDGKFSIDGRNITNLRFADDIHALAEEERK